MRKRAPAASLVEQYVLAAASDSAPSICTGVRRIVGHFRRLTSSPSRTQNFFELSFIFVLSVMLSACVALDQLLDEQDLVWQGQWPAGLASTCRPTLLGQARLFDVFEGWSNRAIRDEASLASSWSRNISFLNLERTHQLTGRTQILMEKVHPVNCAEPNKGGLVGTPSIRVAQTIRHSSSTIDVPASVEPRRIRRHRARQTPSSGLPNPK